MNTTEQKRILLSKRGMNELKKSITRLEAERLDAIKTLRELDRSTGHDERLERIEKLAILEGIEMELQEKQTLLHNARPLPSRRARIRVAIGSVVELIDQQGRLMRYTIVDSIEANPSEGRISADSPLGSTLLGKTVQDIVEWSSALRVQKPKLVPIS